MIHIESPEQFESEVTNFDGVVLVDFYADRCGPCKMLGPTIENLAADYESDESVKIAKIDVDKVPELAGKFGVMSIPTIITFARGAETDKSVGVLTIDQLKSKIEESKK